MNQRQRKRRLIEYRRRQARIAADRDNYICQNCGKPGVDVHHVFGRASTWSDDGDHERYERADRLITLCRACHDRCHHTSPVILRDEMIELLERVLCV